MRTGEIIPGLIVVEGVTKDEGNEGGDRVSLHPTHVIRKPRWISEHTFRVLDVMPILVVSYMSNSGFSDKRDYVWVMQLREMRVDTKWGIGH